MDLSSREKELIILNELLSSDKSEFLAVTGRRRIGKTYLIDTVYKNSWSSASQEYRMGVWNSNYFTSQTS